MINYNDGNWHGWNGGECPVHPKSMVEATGYEGARKSTTAFSNYTSGLFPWDNFRGAFRVVKEYREPREFWIVGQMLLAFPSAREAKTALPGCTPIHVREVTE